MKQFLPWREMSADDWSAVAGALRQGELVLLPTDTVYGLAAWSGAAAALEKIYRLKGRLAGKPLALAFSDLAEVEGFFPDLAAEIRQALAALLPGPVTAIIPAGRGQRQAADVPGGDSAGIRVLPGEFALAGRQLPTPLALTSANLSGGTDPCSITEVPPTVLQGCRFVLDAGRREPCLPSTVVDLRPLAAGGQPRILRPGAWDAAKIESLIGTIQT